MDYKSYIINLKKDTKKYKKISKRLDDIGLKYSRFDGVNGKNIVNNYNKYIAYKHILPSGMIGVGLSHYLVCKKHFDK